MARSRSYLIIFLLCLPLISCGDLSEPKLDFIGFPIINGQTDTSLDHMSIVLVMSNGGMCSGTLIAPRVIMTAAHCADGISPGSFTIKFGNSIYTATDRYVDDKWVHPYYNEQQITNDIALLRLSSNAPSGVVPIPYLPKSIGITTADVGSTPIEFVGFGMTDPYDDYSSGTKMTLTDTLSWVCYSGGGCGYYNPGQMNTICINDTPGGLCSGDSGGPALVSRGGQEYVAGISSYVGGNCEQFSCCTKVDEFEDDIRDFIGGLNGVSCSSAAQCDSGKCVDGVCCASNCPAECMGCNVPGHLGECVEVSNGTFCLDNDLCNGPETCQNGSCVSGQPLDCSNANKCTGETCDPAQGCLFEPMANGTSCSNGNACDGAETCLNGMCTSGTALNCNDNNPCTADSCNPAVGGCLNTDLADGTNCGGGLCGEATCSAGKCISHDTATCDDSDPCTRDWCNPDTGCVNAAVPEGYACGECMMCTATKQCVEVADCGAAGGCGCASSTNSPGGMFGLALLALAFMLRRKR
jgi:MYXO-CTERM domain-containing protein